MNAIVQDHYGSASALRFDDVERPDYGDEDVLVQVVAAGVG
jgi:NADPH:quinone reductase-like Zn-dependent oxidoreductase